MLTVNNIITQTGVTENEATRLLAFFKKFIFEEFNINLNKIGTTGQSLYELDRTAKVLWIGPHTAVTSHANLVRHPYTNIIYGVSTISNCEQEVITGTYGITDEEMLAIEAYFYAFAAESDSMNGSRVKRERDIASEVEVFGASTTYDKMRDMLDYNSIVSYKRDNYAVL
jgi:hypothetical protein